MMIDFYISIVAFCIMSVVLCLFNLNKLNKLENKKNKKGDIKFTEIKYLNFKYGLDMKSLTNKKFLIFISIIDAFIISVTYYVIMLIPVATAFQLLVGFVLLFLLIYSIYGIIGTILVKKGKK